MEVIYLTGAPASGKSSLSEAVAAIRDDVKVFSYSKELAIHIARRNRKHLTEDRIRRQSAKIVTRSDVDAVDRQLALFLSSNRRRSHIIVDSHAVTKEWFGFRVTPFTKKALKSIGPTKILVLIASDAVTRARIRRAPKGRPMPTIFEANFHTHLQASLAMIYALELSAPIYYLNASLPRNRLKEHVRLLLDKH